jgi:hypothetical protein
LLALIGVVGTDSTEANAEPSPVRVTAIGLTLTLAISYPSGMLVMIGTTGTDVVFICLTLVVTVTSEG